MNRWCEEMEGQIVYRKEDRRRKPYVGCCRFRCQTQVSRFPMRMPLDLRVHSADWVCLSPVVWTSSQRAQASLILVLKEVSAAIKAKASLLCTNLISMSTPFSVYWSWKKSSLCSLPIRYIYVLVERLCLSRCLAINYQITTTAHRAVGIWQHQVSAQQQNAAMIIHLDLVAKACVNYRSIELNTMISEDVMIFPTLL